MTEHGEKKRTFVLRWTGNVPENFKPVPHLQMEWRARGQSHVTALPQALHWG